MTHTTSDVRLRESLTAFAPTAEGVSLYLLRAINETVDSLQSLEKLANATSEAGEQLRKAITGRAVVEGSYLDADDTAINLFEAGIRALEEHLPTLLLRKGSIDGDSSLDASQADLLHTSYDRCIDSVACLIESMKNLRAAVITHDLAAEPRPVQIFDSTEDLINSLRATA